VQSRSKEEDEEDEEKGEEEVWRRKPAPSSL
jgi:hypothetical protein